MTKKEFAQIRQDRKMTQSSLDLSNMLEKLRARHKLKDIDLVELLLTHVNLYAKTTPR